MSTKILNSLVKYFAIKPRVEVRMLISYDVWILQSGKLILRPHNFPKFWGKRRERDFENHVRVRYQMKFLKARKSKNMLRCSRNQRTTVSRTMAHRHQISIVPMICHFFSHILDKRSMDVSLTHTHVHVSPISISGNDERVQATNVFASTNVQQFRAA